MKTGIRAVVAAGLASGALSVAAGAEQTEIVLDEAEARQEVAASEVKPQRPGNAEQAAARKMRERMRERMREKMHARRKANTEFWQSLKDKEPAQALAEVKVHVTRRHAERKQEMAEFHEERVARIEEKVEDADRKAKALELAQKRHAQALARAEQHHAEVTEKLNALDDKEDLTHADIRKALKPPQRKQGPQNRPGRKRREQRGKGDAEKPATEATVPQRDFA
jgi:hypothetical protein